MELYALRKDAWLERGSTEIVGIYYDVDNAKQEAEREIREWGVKNGLTIAGVKWNRLNKVDLETLKVTGEVWQAQFRVAGLFIVYAVPLEDAANIQRGADVEPNPYP